MMRDASRRLCSQACLEVGHSCKHVTSDRRCNDGPPAVMISREQSKTKTKCCSLLSAKNLRAARDALLFSLSILVFLIGEL